MARIDLNVHLSTSDLDEAADILARLKGLKSEPRLNEYAEKMLACDRVVEVAKDAEPQETTEAVNDAPQTRKGRGPNKPKDPQPEVPAASVAAEPSKTEASPASGAPTASASDGLAAQDATVEQVRELLKQFVSTEGKSMVEAQRLMGEHFTTPSGEPVKRLTDLQPKDYAKTAQVFRAALGL